MDIKSVVRAKQIAALLAFSLVVYKLGFVQGNGTLRVYFVFSFITLAPGFLVNQWFYGLCEEHLFDEKTRNFISYNGVQFALMLIEFLFLFIFSYHLNEHWDIAIMFR